MIKVETKIVPFDEIVLYREQIHFVQDGIIRNIAHVVMLFLAEEAFISGVAFHDHG